jgi:hypothetical protein
MEEFDVEGGFRAEGEEEQQQAGGEQDGGGFALAQVPRGHECDFSSFPSAMKSIGLRGRLFEPGVVGRAENPMKVRL